MRWPRREREAGRSAPFRGNWRSEEPAVNINRASGRPPREAVSSKQRCRSVKSYGDGAVCPETEIPLGVASVCPPATPLGGKELTQLGRDRDSSAVAAAPASNDMAARLRTGGHIVGAEPACTREAPAAQSATNSGKARKRDGADWDVFATSKRCKFRLTRFPPTRFPPGFRLHNRAVPRESACRGAPSRGFRR